MKIITDIKEANDLLHLYIGATLQIFIFSTSLKRMALRLVLPNVNEVVYIVGISCESINGRFSYKNAHISITTRFNNEVNQTETIITDRLARFELITSGGFSLAQGTEMEFGESFDNFIKEKNNRLP
jgi:hypothetical protein